MLSPRRLAVASWLGVFVCASGFAQNLHPNPDFDDSEGAAGWTAGPGTVAAGAADASDCPASGSLLAAAEEIGPLEFALEAVGPCIAFAETTVLDLRLRYRGTAGPSDENSLEYRIYLDDACGTADGGGSLTFGEVGPSWSSFGGGFTVLAGGSVRIVASSTGETGGTIEIDEIRLATSRPLLLDGFDGGGTCRWSSAVP